MMADVKLGSDTWGLLSPATQVSVLRDALLNAKPGFSDPLVLPDGTYDMGDKEVLIGMKSSPGNPVVIKGNPGRVLLRSSQTLRLPANEKDANGRDKLDDKGRTILKLNPDGTPVDRGATTCFIHGHEVVFDGVGLESTCAPNRQSCMVGPGWDLDTRWDIDAPRKATFRNTNMLCRAFGPYLWHCDLDTFIFEENNRITAANVCIGMGRSSGYLAQIVRFIGKNNILVLDPGRSIQHGEVTNDVDGGQAGIMARGGQLYVDVPITILGRGNDDLIGGPLLAGVTDHMAGGSVHTMLKIAGLNCKLAPGKTTKIFADVEIGLIGTAPSTTGKVLIGGNGSAPDGSLLIRRKAA